MHLSLPFPEALELALQGAALPSIVRELTCSEATIRADVDLRAVPNPPFALRAVAAVSPIVRVHATFRAFDEGAATFDLTVRAGSVPVQRLLNQLTGLLNSALRGQHLPEGLVAIRQGPGGEPLVVIELQSAIAVRAEGITLTRFAIADGAVELAATIRSVALHPSPPRRV